MALITITKAARNLFTTKPRLIELILRGEIRLSAEDIKKLRDTDRLRDRRTAYADTKARDPVTNKYIKTRT